MDVTKISFPGLGIGAIEIPTCAFSIGSFQVSWGLLIITVGIALACWYAACRAKRAESVPSSRMLLICAAAVVVGVIFARGGYVLSTLKSGCYKNFYDVIAFWEGGMSFDAGILGAIIGAMTVSDIFRYKGSRVLDALVGGVLLVQMLAALSSFLVATETVAIADTSSYYLFGAPLEFVVADKGLLNAIGMEVARGGEIALYHPLFLYQLVWSLAAFLTVHFTYKHRRFSGQSALIYFAFFGFGMMLRGAILPGVKDWNAMQCWGAVIFVAALIALIVYTYRACQFSVEVSGTLIERRSFVRVMTDEERAEKVKADKAEAEALLEKKVEACFAELDGNS